MRTVLAVSPWTSLMTVLLTDGLLVYKKIPGEKAIAERRFRYYNSTVILNAVIMGVL